ncbi:MAG: gliding motility protein [Candidatus Methanoperedens nitroreducens]|uniref:Gliding motility protein n=1 Tax=Candidatus Methanoperedens nitratireducens TaxID=1392998 RepID=A0A0P8DZ73_9EURY|nr:ABC transporter ATP-binding protein [Candidatus Methanoperedens sp. BLZ2]KAB2946654.1 MAG: ABC transporter ATP-binding protein [Candidatus Methanoperedens sp.]KPQ43153.1 MAG: gliding motility protein [Candidatus Methanoperedens sp. BLZ1]MBZ0173991.1 ABC transporter ATP-binding protein [Candidatus Methanoperedens nitroreducens]MCX9078905.1 ABC transporter ATP-binding protein [Candidatus Methanoperedens sp.]MCX9088586.1 ABC transporter ATP-binding protein [Candidatus Methanoperedens sp.]
MNEIEVTGLRKEYGSFTAVESLDFDVLKGEIFGIVGPNGAGKTTTLKMLSGLIIPSLGSIKIQGLDIRKNSGKIKQKLGFLPEESPLYEGMTAIDYLMFFSEIYGIEKQTALTRIRELLGALKLDARDKKIGEMSKGMQRKVAIARALINDPEYLILDEMTSGLDPTTSKYLSDFVLELKKQGKTIIFSAHNLYQVESICDHILIMNRGKVVSTGTMPQIRKMCGAIEYSIEFNVRDNFDFAARKNNGNFITVTHDIDEFNNITGWVAKHNGKIINIKTVETSLEDIFLKLMN